MNNGFFIVLIIGFVLTALLVIVLVESGGGAYRDGQIDALNGKIYYELRQQEDGTTDWEYCPEGCLIELKECE